jgi:hypothetical protein
MPGMDVLDAGAIAAHYRSVADPVAHHLAGRPVISAGWSVTGPAAVTTTTALAEAVDAGCRWFAVPAQAWRPWSLVRLVPGPGADSATTATVALALLETVPGGDGIAIGDGADGMVVALPAGVPAESTMDDLAARAPELATVLAGQDAGRVLVRELTGSDPVPVPYSLIDLPDGTGVVLPLHVDEIAAAAAGMPLEFEPEDAARRLAARGDLAERLAGSA